MRQNDKEMEIKERKANNIKLLRILKKNQEKKGKQRQKRRN